MLDIDKVDMFAKPMCGAWLILDLRKVDILADTSVCVCECVCVWAMLTFQPRV